MPEPLNLLGAAFITPGFAVAGALLVSVPILIHLLNKRRFRTLRWAAMEYLLQAMRKNRRRLRFEQWILLAARCALLGLLGLALARPLGCDRGLIGAVGQSAGLHVIVIDNSLSMGYDANRPNARTHLDQAKMIARKLLDRIERSGPNEAISVIATSNLDSAEPHRPLKATALFAKPTYDVDSARQAVERLEQSYGACDLAGSLQMALEVAREEQKQPRKTLYILSDVTQADWGEKSPQAEALRSTGVELSKVFQRPVVFNLGKPEQWNFALAELAPSNRLVNSKFDVDLVATPVAYGAPGATQLQWKLDEKPLDAGGALRLDERTLPQIIQKKISEGGPRVVAATLLNDEGLKSDNTRQIVLDVVSELKVLVVEGERGAEALESSGAYLELALAPQKEATAGAGARKSDSYAAVDLITDMELANAELSRYRCVILTNVGQVSSGEAERLERFVKDGGGLILFMGEQVKGEAYNNILLPRKLMPGKLIARRSESGEAAKGYAFDFNPRGNVHPILRVFKDQDNTGLNTARVFTYYQCEVPADSRVETVLGFAGDKAAKDPAITVHTLGKGTVAFVATTANGAWNNLTPKPAWVPLVHELLGACVSSGDRWMNLTVGQCVEVPASLRLPPTPRLVDSSGKEKELESTTSPEGQVVYRSRPLTRPGLYRVKSGTNSYPIAVNVPASEADLRVLKEPQIRRALGDIDILVQGDAVPTETLVTDESNDLSWALMLIVLALAGAECFMAMRFGHYRKATLAAHRATAQPAPAV